MRVIFKKFFFNHFIVVLLVFNIGSALLGQEKIKAASKTILKPEEKPISIEKVDQYQKPLFGDVFSSLYYPNRNKLDNDLSQESLFVGNWEFYAFVFSLKFDILWIDSADWNQKLARISTVKKNQVYISSLSPFVNMPNLLQFGRSGSLEPPTGAPNGLFLMNNLLMDFKVIPSSWWAKNPLEKVELRFFYFY